MSITSRTLGSVLFSLVLLSGSAWAATSTIQGIVTDQNGKVLPAAEIRIQAKNDSSWSKVVKTDATGHYAYGGVTVGATYQVSLLVKGTVKASISNVQIKKVGAPTQLNFNLQKNSGVQTAANAPVKKKTHTVWVPPDTGSNLGGRWVEVDDSGAAATAGASNVGKAGNDAIRNMHMGNR
jgi:hypothetical protein